MGLNSDESARVMGYFFIYNATELFLKSVFGGVSTFTSLKSSDATSLWLTR
jgi:hypothetical protein